MTLFGMRLEAVRRHYGSKIGRPRLNRGQMAETLEMDRARYARYERGETEPSLKILERIRNITGVSLDWLIAALPVGEQPNPIMETTLGDRLRWAREIQEPWMIACATVMQVQPDIWKGYEEDRISLPVDRAAEFAHRFSVTLDYLYLGKLDGIAAPVRDALLLAHPELSLNDIRSELPERYQVNARRARRHQAVARKARATGSTQASNIEPEVVDTVEPVCGDDG